MLAAHRDLFDIPRDVAYLNNASYSPLPRAVRSAGDLGVAAKSTPWLMDPDAIAQVETAVRAAAASFIGATADDIAIVPSVAYGIATASVNLPLAAGSRILLIEGEFPSQALEWARRASDVGAMLDVVPRPRQPNADQDWTAALLARIAQPGLPPVAIAALTPLDWNNGSLIDLGQVTAALRAHGAAIVVDATQAVGVLPLDVAALGADYLVFPTYKWLLGPYTLAFLYVAPARQDGRALEQHGASRTGGWNTFTGRIGEPVPTARRFDMGQRLNPVGLPMALAGMAMLQGWGMAALRERQAWLTGQLADAAEAHGLRPVPAWLRAPHILGLQPPAGITADSFVASLARHGVHAAARSGWIRIGAHIFNDEQDVSRFTTALPHAIP